MPPSEHVALRETARLAASIAAVVALSIVVYLPVASGGFVQDDHPIVEENPIVRQGGLAEIFATDYQAGVGGGDPGLYRPVTILTFALERGPDGVVSPEKAHRVNIALHALVSAALVLLARRLGAGLGASTAAGLLFAAHPVHVAAVSCLVGRAEVLAALFTVAALLAQSAGRGFDLGAPLRSRIVDRAGPFVAALFLFLALGSKETAIAAPPLLVLVETIGRARGDLPRAAWIRARLLALAPSAAAALAWFVLRGRAIGGLFRTQHVMLSDNPLKGMEPLDRLGTALGLAARSLGLLVAPVRLSPDYSGGVIPKESGIFSPLALAGVVVLAGAALAVLLPWLRAPGRGGRSGSAVPARLRRLSAAAALFLLPYLVTGNLLVLVGVVFAERLLYLPSSGFCLLVPLLAGAAIARAPRSAALVAPALLVLALVPYSVKTWRSSASWTSDTLLWEYAVREEPRSPRAQFTLGRIRLDQGREEEAFAHFTRATDLWPYYSSAWYEKGRILARRGDLAAAAEAFRTAATQNPGNENAATNLGIALHRLSRLREAEAALRDAAARFPDSSRIAAELGHVLFDSGRFGDAAEAYRRAVALGRRDLEARLADSEARARSR